MLKLTLGNRMEASEVPARQVGGDAAVLCSHPGAPQQSTHWRRRTTKHANAARVHLPPKTVREVRNLQNFFAFPQQEKEEEALEDEDEEEATKRKEDLPEDDPEERLDCCCCCEK